MLAPSAFRTTLEADPSLSLKITSFRGACSFLSNMHPAPCKYEGDVFPTVEHAFQAAKAAPADRADYRDLGLDAKGAKRLGRKKPLAKGGAWWEANKVGVMEACVRSKFSDAALGALLCATGDRELIEGNTWGDTYWGVSSGSGSNHLGNILMKVRDELRPYNARELRRKNARPIDRTNRRKRGRRASIPERKGGGHEQCKVLVQEQATVRCY